MLRKHGAQGTPQMRMFVQNRCDALLSNFMQSGALQCAHRRIARRPRKDGVRSEDVAGSEAGDLLLDATRASATHADDTGLDNEDRIAGLALFVHHLPFAELPAT